MECIFWDEMAPQKFTVHYPDVTIILLTRVWPVNQQVGRGTLSVSSSSECRDNCGLSSAVVHQCSAQLLFAAPYCGHLQWMEQKLHRRVGRYNKICCQSLIVITVQDTLTYRVIRWLSEMSLLQPISSLDYFTCKYKSMSCFLPFIMELSNWKYFYIFLKHVVET